MYANPLIFIGVFLLGEKSTSAENEGIPTVNTSLDVPSTNSPAAPVVVAVISPESYCAVAGALNTQAPGSGFSIQVKSYALLSGGIVAN